MPSAEMPPESVDPRIRRTRRLLQDALVRLLKKSGFDEISVQDIAEEATINRATFYAHYPDKYALLESVTATRFFALLDERGARFDTGDCAAAYRSIVLAVCDYLVSFQDARCAKHQANQRQTQPHMELAMIAVLRNLFLDGLKQHPPSSVSAEMVATTASWAIFGAAKEWASTPNRVPAEQIVDVVVKLVSPVFQSATG